MKVLVLGSGGREHAVARKLSESSSVSKVYVLPGNGGTRLMGGKVENVNIRMENYDEVLSFATREAVGMACIGPEQPIADGLWDKFAAQGIPCVGPSSSASILESSKAWSKDFMVRNGIPTARHRTFKDTNKAINYLKSIDYEVVVKASGLAGGKGVIIPHSSKSAEQAVRCMLQGKVYGEAGKEIVIEERLVGEEVSLLAFCDGRVAVCMPPAQDHKRAFNNDEGPNTGGMGAYAPAPALAAASPELQQLCADIVQCTVSALAAEGRPFQGILYTGLMLTASGPVVLEYNCRFGDPETQVLLPLLDSDLLDIFNACINGRLSEDMVKWKKGCACTVVCAISGYPSHYSTGSVISGVDAANAIDSVIVYHSGTSFQEDVQTTTSDRKAEDVTPLPTDLVTTSGRVFAVTGLGQTIRQAIGNAYKGVEKLSFKGLRNRTDIGHRALATPLRIGILGSTRGTDMQFIINAIEAGTLPARIVACVSNKESSGILDKARKHHIKAVHIGAANLEREEYDAKVTEVFEQANVDLVLLIGYMRIVSPAFVQKWKYRCLNVHPSLLPEFAGGMDKDVHAAVLAAGREITGCTVHFVEDVVDGGPIVVQKSCAVDLQNDTPDTLKARVQALEGQALIEAINLFRDEKIGPFVEGGVIAQQKPSESTTASAPITYKAAGVDIDAGARLVDRIKPFCRATSRPGCNADLGGFGALFDLQQAGLSGGDDTVLVSGADGVGTKLLIAQAVGKHDTIGIDLVAMNANDVVVCGAQPLFFLDYFSSGHLDVDVAAEVISGIAEGCMQAGAALIGGETAEMAGMYAPGVYDLAGFCVGSVKRSLLLPRRDDMVVGDVLLGLPSSGLHSNGFSLVRKCVEKEELSWTSPAPFEPSLPLGEALLCPTKIYIRTLMPLITKGLVKGMAHITGGGLLENTPRMLPSHLSACVDIDESGWSLPGVFQWVMRVAGISQSEMLRTLNCGIGMVLVVSSEHYDEAMAVLQAQGQEGVLTLGRLCDRGMGDSPQVIVTGSFQEH